MQRFGRCVHNRVVNRFLNSKTTSYAYSSTFHALFDHGSYHGNDLVPQGYIDY
jgi:hypothetical protein